MSGLALEGGGAKGAYHLGVVRAYAEAGALWSGVVGTSIGSINGAAIASGAWEEAYRLWEDIRFSDIFPADDDVLEQLMQLKLSRHSIDYLRLKFKEVVGGRGLDTSRMTAFLERTIDEDKLRASSVLYGLVAINLTDRKALRLFLEDIPQGQLHAYLLASSSLPIFRRTTIDDKLFLDGGLYDNCPVDMLVSRGFQEIVAIHCYRQGITPPYRRAGAMITHVFPSDDTGPVLGFHSSWTRRNLRMGYYDGLRAVRNLRGRRYYIDPGSVDADRVSAALSRLSPEAMRALAGQMGAAQYDPRRGLYERVLPGVARALSVPPGADYGELLIAMAENRAERCRIDRFELVSLPDLARRAAAAVPAPQPEIDPVGTAKNLVSGANRTAAAVDLLLPQIADAL